MVRIYGSTSICKPNNRSWAMTAKPKSMSMTEYDGDLSQYIEKMERAKQRWQHVQENRDKLVVNQQVMLKQKLDKQVKRHKDKLKNREESIGD